MITRRLPPQPREWIDRAASGEFLFRGAALQRIRGRHALERSGGQRRQTPGPKFQVSSAPRHLQPRESRRQRPRGRWPTHEFARDILPVDPGCRFTATNTFGGLAADRAHWIDRCSAFLPVGFYYKTFHRPRRWFPFFERRMRQLAGLGAINRTLPRGHTPKRYDFCEVLVVGAGAAGLAAAIAAAEAGADVLLVDEQPRVGGCLNYSSVGDAEAERIGAELRARLDLLSNVRTRVATLAAGCYADRWVALVDQTKLIKLRAGSIVLATGCYEQPAVFGNNDLPGVMLGSAAQRLIHCFAVRPCDSAVVLAANSDGYRLALDLARSGAQVAAIVDLRPAGEPTEVAHRVAGERIRVFAGHAVYEARPTSDNSGTAKAALRGVVVCPLGSDGLPRVEQATELECDGLVMSVGYAPADALFYQSGGRMCWSEELAQFAPHTAPDGIFAAGRVNGVYALADKLADGRRAARPPRPTSAEKLAHNCRRCRGRPSRRIIPIRSCRTRVPSASSTSTRTCITRTS